MPLASSTVMTPSLPTFCIASAIISPISARPLAEQDTIAGLHREGDDLALLVARTGADSDHLPFHRLFLGGVGDDDSACGLLLAVETMNHHAIMQWPEFQWIMD
jgi:hypothetical protein